MLLLSIVIPVGNAVDDFYNLNKWLYGYSEEQSEIVFVLDCDENSKKIFKEMLGNRIGATKIQVTESNSRAPGTSRNQGMQLARGKWICFWDSDDSPNAENFLKMIKKADKEDKILVAGNYIHKVRKSVIEEHLHILPKKIGKKSYQNLIFDPGLWRFAFKRDLVQELRFKDWQMAEDQTFLADALIKANQIALEEEVVYTYDQSHRFQLTKSLGAKEDLIQALNKNIDLFNQQPSNIRFNLVFKLYLSCMKNLSLDKSKLISLSILKLFVSCPIQYKFKFLSTFLFLVKYESCKK